MSSFTGSIKILYLPNHARKFVGLKDAKEAAKLLSGLAVGVLSELKDLPSKVVAPDWLEKVEEKKTIP